VGNEQKLCMAPHWRCVMMNPARGPPSSAAAAAASPPPPPPPEEEEEEETSCPESEDRSSTAMGLDQELRRPFDQLSPVKRHKTKKKLRLSFSVESLISDDNKTPMVNDATERVGCHPHPSRGWLPPGERRLAAGEVPTATDLSNSSHEETVHLGDQTEHRPPTWFQSCYTFSQSKCVCVCVCCIVLF